MEALAAAAALAEDGTRSAAVAQLGQPGKISQSQPVPAKDALAIDMTGSNDDLVKNESCLKIEQATSTAGGIMSSVSGNAHSMRWYAAHRSASGRRLHTGGGSVALDKKDLSPVKLVHRNLLSSARQAIIEAQCLAAGNAEDDPPMAICSRSDAMQHSSRLPGSSGGNADLFKQWPGGVLLSSTPSDTLLLTSQSSVPISQANGSTQSQLHASVAAQPAAMTGFKALLSRGSPDFLPDYQQPREQAEHVPNVTQQHQSQSQPHVLGWLPPSSMADTPNLVITDVKADTDTSLPACVAALPSDIMAQQLPAADPCVFATPAGSTDVQQANGRQAASCILNLETFNSPHSSVAAQSTSSLPVVLAYQPSEPLIDGQNVNICVDEAVAANHSANDRSVDAYGRSIESCGQGTTSQGQANMMMPEAAMAILHRPLPLHVAVSQSASSRPPELFAPSSIAVQAGHALRSWLQQQQQAKGTHEKSPQLDQPEDQFQQGSHQELVSHVSQDSQVGQNSNLVCVTSTANAAQLSQLPAPLQLPASVQLPASTQLPILAVPSSRHDDLKSCSIPGDVSGAFEGFNVGAEEQGRSSAAAVPGPAFLGELAAKSKQRAERALPRKGDSTPDAALFNQHRAGLAFWLCPGCRIVKPATAFPLTGHNAARMVPQCGNCGGYTRKRSTKQRQSASKRKNLHAPDDVDRLCEGPATVSATEAADPTRASVSSEASSMTSTGSFLDGGGCRDDSLPQARPQPRQRQPQWGSRRRRRRTTPPFTSVTPAVDNLPSIVCSTVSPLNYVSTAVMNISPPLSLSMPAISSVTLPVNSAIPAASGSVPAVSGTVPAVSHVSAMPNVHASPAGLSGAAAVAGQFASPTLAVVPLNDRGQVQCNDDIGPNTAVRIPYSGSGTCAGISGGLQRWLTSTAAAVSAATRASLR